jgi:hypothetical protein
MTLISETELPPFQSSSLNVETCAFERSSLSLSLNREYTGNREPAAGNKSGKRHGYHKA